MRFISVCHVIQHVTLIFLDLFNHRCQVGNGISVFPPSLFKKGFNVVWKIDWLTGFQRRLPLEYAFSLRRRWRRLLIFSQIKLGHEPLLR